MHAVSTKGWLYKETKLLLLIVFFLIGMASSLTPSVAAD